MPQKQGTLSILGVITYYWFANGNEVNLGHSSYRFILEIGVKVLVCMSESHRKRKRCELDITFGKQPLRKKYRATLL